MTPARRRVVAGVATVVALLAAAAASLVVQVQGKTYRSTAVLTVDQPSVLTRTALPGPVLKLQQLRAEYAQLLTTQAVVGAVAARVGRSASSVQQHLQVTASKDSLLVLVSGLDDDRAAARTLAAAAADELARFVTQEQTDASVAPADQVALTVAGPAGTPEVVRGGARTVATTAAFAAAVATALVVLLSSWVRTPER